MKTSNLRNTQTHHVLYSLALFISILSLLQEVTLSRFIFTSPNHKFFLRDNTGHVAFGEDDKEKSCTMTIINKKKTFTGEKNNKSSGASSNPTTLVWQSFCKVSGGTALGHPSQPHSLSERPDAGRWHWAFSLSTMRHWDTGQWQIEQNFKK